MFRALLLFFIILLLVIFPFHSYVEQQQREYESECPKEVHCYIYKTNGGLIFGRIVSLKVDCNQKYDYKKLECEEYGG